MSFTLKKLRDAAREGKAKEPSTDPAWLKAGDKQGLEIWRIEDFTVKPWPKEKYGKFFSGDSYIVLNTIVAGAAPSYDVHFWLGSKTSQDEAGTAAYKTVELDDHLGGIPVQYREVEGYESDKFLNLFPKGVVTLSGGVDSGFNVVKPETYTPRLLHIAGSLKSASAVEVPLSRESLNSDDVFILDAGLELFQWNGSSSNAGEKSKGGAILRELRTERNFKGDEDPIILEEGEDNDRFWTLLGVGDKAQRTEKIGSSKGLYKKPEARQKKIFKLSDASGSLTFTEVASGNIKRDVLTSADVFIVDSGRNVYAWVGADASANEKRNAIVYAEEYLEKYGISKNTPIIRTVEKHENSDFNEAF